MRPWPTTCVWMLKPVPAKPVSRTVIALGPDEHLANLNDLAVAISPDGAYVVYVATRGSGRAQLFLRRLDALKAEPVAGTEDAVSPFFSPDSQWIAFFAGGKLKKVAIGGGAAVTLYDAITALGATSGTWGPKNTILFGSGNRCIFASSRQRALCAGDGDGETPGLALA